jgi:hypothetical protein
MPKAKDLSAGQMKKLLDTLDARFDKNTGRHKGIDWTKVRLRLESKPAKLQALFAMEESGGEPDVIGQEGGEFIFVDCSAESPKGRRSLCYDKDAWNSRKEHKPKGGDAVSTAAAMGIELLDEAEYRHLQTLGEFDTKTSSWVKTPTAVRDLGGAIFCDRRFDRVFTYHNGAESYYAARGFRGILRV